MTKKRKTTSDVKANQDTTKKDKVVADILGREETDPEKYNFYTEAQKRSEALAEIDSELTKEEKAALEDDAKRRFTSGQ